MERSIEMTDDVMNPEVSDPLPDPELPSCIPTSTLIVGLFLWISLGVNIFVVKEDARLRREHPVEVYTPEGRVLPPALVPVPKWEIKNFVAGGGLQCYTVYGDAFYYCRVFEDLESDGDAGVEGEDR
jgi:hypothetical protein